MGVYGSKIETKKWYPSNPHKYRGDVNNIISRSSWETKAFNWMDNNRDVVSWSSESVILPYFDPIQNKMRRYFVDLWAEIKTNTGVIRRYLIEIKPDKFTRPPTQPKRITKSYLAEATQYVTNRAKWDAAEAVCKQNGVEFLILTEHDLFGSKNKK